MKHGAIWFGAFVAYLLSFGAAAQGVDMQALVSVVKQGGYVIVLRHGATNRDQADTDPLNFDNVAKQRVLSTQGREHAKQLLDRDVRHFRVLPLPSVVQRAHQSIR